MNDAFVIIHILGAVQGVFLAAILVSRRRGSVANGILAITMLAFALDLASAVYHATGYDAAFPHLIGFDYPLAFLYGPLLYLYARTLTHRERKFSMRYLWHFAPFALLVLFLVPFYLQTGPEKLAFARGPGSDIWTEVLGTVNHLKLVHAFIYIGMILSLLKRRRQRIRETHSSMERTNLTWLRNLMIGIIAMTAAVVILYLQTLGSEVPVMGLDPATVYDDYTLLCLALLVYAVGFMGLRQPEVFDGRHHHDDAPERTSDHATVDGKPQYARSGMDPESASRYKRDLLELMETEKLYRRGDLTLQDLSESLSISAHNLTEVINTRLGQNFYDFVNGYRVRDVKERLADPQFDHLTILAIAMECGFNSKSTFNAIFKKHVRMTPSEFRSRVREMTAS